MNTRYNILCFANGATPDLAVWEEYSCYTYTKFINTIIQGIVAKHLEQAKEEHINADKLLVSQIEQIDGRPASMEHLCTILQERVRHGRPTILIGDYIPAPILNGIPENAVFMAEG